MHEFDHLFRCLSTSHGVVRHSLISLLCTSAVRYVAASDGLENRVFPFEVSGHPLVVAAQQRKSRRKLFSKAKRLHPAQRHLLQYLCYRELLAAWDGRRPVLPHLVEPGLALFEVSLRSAFGSDGNTPRFLNPWDADEVPEWRAVHNGRFITSTSLYESFAVETELVFAQRFGRTAENSTDLFGDEQYRLAVAVFDQVFRERGSRRIPLEFDACVDLALWVPFTLRGTAIWAAHFQWTDLEPGHRFCKALGVLQDIGYRDWHYAEERSDPNAADQPFIQAQELIATKLGWPTPRTLNDALVRQVTEIDGRGDCPSAYAVIERASPRTAWVLRLLRERRDAPFSSFYQLVHQRFGDTGIYFPAILCTDKIVVNTGLPFDSEVSNLTERQILAGSQMLIDGAASHAFTRSEALDALERIAGYGQSLLRDPQFPANLLPWKVEIESRPPSAPPKLRGAGG